MTVMKMHYVKIPNKVFSVSVKKDLKEMANSAQV